MEKKVILRKVKPEYAPSDIDWDSMNYTELLQLCKFNEIPGASGAVPREMLIKALETMEPINATDPLMKIKVKYRNWLLRNWVSKGFQLQVPYSFCPNCLDCEDMQVAKCWVEDHEQVT